MRLLLLVLVVAVPLSALSALALWRAKQSERGRAESAMVTQARTMALALDGSFQRVEAALQALAASDALMKGDLPGFEREMRMVAAGLPDVLSIGLNAPDGRQVLDTGWPHGSPIPDTPSPAAVSGAFATARAQISDLAYVPSARRFIVGVSVPVRSDTAGAEPAYVLNAGLSPALFDRLLAAAPGLEQDEFAAIDDRAGTIVARTRQEARFVGRKGLPDVLAQLAHEPEGVVHVAALLDDGPGLIAFAHAPESGYSVLLGIPDAVFNAAATSPIWRTLALAGVLAAIGLIAALIVARQIIGALRRVARITGAPTGIREIDSLARDLSAATVSLRASEAQFRATFEQAAVGMALVGSNGRFEGVNRRLCAMLAYDEPELLGKTFAEITHPDDAPANEAQMERALRGEISSVSLEKRYQRRDGSIVWAELSSALVRGADGKPSRFITTIQDISERKRAEAALRELTEQLEIRVHAEVAAREVAQTRAAQAERMQALGLLAGGVAHDINNVLQAVQGAAALIERRADDSAEAARFARMVIDAAERGASVTRRLLAFARRSELRTEPISLPELVNSLAPIIAVTVGAGMVVKFEVPANLPPVLADRGQLETVLVNLVTNARDAMPDGGALRIAMSERTPTGDEGEPPGMAPGRYVCLSIADTGVGMDAATLTRVTEPFFTTKPMGKGTGLGLAMAKGFAEQSGGGLAIDSTPGRGTTVHLWLPRASRPETGAGGELDVLCPVQSAPKTARVLVVDDDRPVLETMAAQLEDSGFAVVTAGGADEALALIDAGAPVDALVTDLSMPGLSGVDLIRRAQERRPRLRALLLTGYESDDAAQALCSATRGTVLVMSKPAPTKRLAGRLAALLASAE